MIESVKDTSGDEYANYLIDNQNSLRSTIVQLPYRAHLKKLSLGRTLDIGCGAGRNLKALPAGSVGIDHNSHLVKACAARGLSSFTTQSFLDQGAGEHHQFDSILISHVAEHMSEAVFVEMLSQYRVYLKPKGRVIVICPQEKGYATDSTHVQFMDFDVLIRCLQKSGFTVEKQYSFPFPRSFGKVFPYNEFVVIGRVPAIT